LNKHDIENIKVSNLDAASIILFMLGASSPASPKNTLAYLQLGPSSQERE